MNIRTRADAERATGYHGGREHRRYQERQDQVTADAVARRFREEAAEAQNPVLAIVSREAEQDPLPVIRAVARGLVKQPPGGQLMGARTLLAELGKHSSVFAALTRAFDASVGAIQAEVQNAHRS